MTSTDDLVAPELTDALQKLMREECEQYIANVLAINRPLSSAPMPDLPLKRVPTVRRHHDCYVISIPIPKRK